jgi:hypothetical protein
MYDTHPAVCRQVVTRQESGVQISYKGLLSQVLLRDYGFSSCRAVEVAVYDFDVDAILQMLCTEASAHSHSHYIRCILCVTALYSPWPQACAVVMNRRVDRPRPHRKISGSLHITAGGESLNRVMCGDLGNSTCNTRTRSFGTKARSTSYRSSIHYTGSWAEYQSGGDWFF